MSVNNVVTAMLALGAIVVSVVALWINRQVDRRATRSALTDLALRVSEQVAAYEKLSPQSEQESFRRKLDIEVLIRQADSLMQQLGTLRPDSVAVSLAQALESVQDFWWADIYWGQAATSDLFRRAITIGYWGLALLYRGDPERASLKTQEAVKGLISEEIDAYIVRGNILASMGEGEGDSESSTYWFDLAQEQFNHIPVSDTRRGAYLGFINEKRNRT